MSIFRHELRRGRSALVLWSAAVGGLLAACLALFPEMEGQMASVGDMFASMGAFTAAFGMDRLDIGTFSGFYAVECGSILSLGGAFFACLAGVSALAKEEREHTAELLLTHPVSRRRVAAEKLLALLAQIALMDGIVLALALLTAAAVGEAVPWRAVLLLHGACALLHGELGCVCFGLSAFLRRSGAGAGVGVAAGLYFLDLIANVTGRARWLKYVTLFGCCDGADLLSAGALDVGMAAAGTALACAALAAGLAWYQRKDIL